MYCTKCGNELNDDDVYCSVCETPVSNNIPTPQSEQHSSKFDAFMTKTFLANGALSYSKAGRIYSSSIILLQVIMLILVLLFNDNFGISYASMIFLFLDWYFLSKQGIRGAWKLWGLVLIPLYLLLRELKTERKFIYPILSTAICVISVITVLLSGFSGGTEEVNYLSQINAESLKSSQDSISQIQKINFNEEFFTCDNYVTLEDDGIKSITPNIYIPTAGTYLYEESWTQSSEDKATSTVTITLDLLNGILFKEDIAGIECYGSYNMTGTSSDDVLVKKYTSNILGQESQNVEMIRLNRTFDCSDGSQLTSPPNNYTVSVRAGTFENCVCMIKINSAEDYTVSYYAPLIGKVLEFHHNEEIGWFLYKELIEVQNETN